MVGGDVVVLNAFRDTLLDAPRGAEEPVLPMAGHIERRMPGKRDEVRQGAGPRTVVA
jgi:hypothetical protein